MTPYRCRLLSVKVYLLALQARLRAHRKNRGLSRHGPGILAGAGDKGEGKHGQGDSELHWWHAGLAKSRQNYCLRSVYATPGSSK